MIQGIYHQKDLNLAELEAIGLAKDGSILLNKGDLQALLAGRRTDLLRLKDLSGDGIRIAGIDAKISLRANAEGKPELFLHPIYKHAAYSAFLTDDEFKRLEKGKVASIEKKLSDTRGNRTSILVEYDRDTNEIIVTDINRILAPDMVNGKYLSHEQKERYRKGKEVEMEDGTRFRYSGTEREGLRSNRIALVASVIIDGGLSFMLYQGLNALFGKKHNAQSAQLSESYNQALSDMKMAEGDPIEWLKRNGQHPDKEYSRGYGRSGTSR
jgi:hypothetical protein